MHWVQEGQPKELNGSPFLMFNTAYLSMPHGHLLSLELDTLRYPVSFSL